MIMTNDLLVLLLMQACWILPITPERLNGFQVQYMGGSVLRLSCRINRPLNGQSLKMSIFEDNLNNTLVSVKDRECPEVETSARSSDIYLPQCVQKAELHSLDLFLTNYNEFENQTFGCRYTFALDGEHVQHSISRAQVSTTGQPSHGADNESTSMSAPHTSLENKEGDTPIPEGIDSCTLGRITINDDLQIAALIVTSCVLFLILCFLLASTWYTRLRLRRNNDQRKLRELEDNQYNETDDLYYSIDTKTTKCQENTVRLIDLEKCDPVIIQTNVDTDEYPYSEVNKSNKTMT